MTKSKSMLMPNATPNISSGILSSFKDLMGIRKHDPPEISVSEPILKSGHHEYKVKGRDHLGEFEMYRRFREFDTFRKVLYSRFLGLYVPPIPPKKSVGKTEDLLVEERMFFLDRFMKQIAELPYLYESEELQVFLRPSVPDVCKALETMPRLTTDDLLARFRVCMPVNEMAGDLKLKAHNEAINEFVRDTRDYLEQLEAFKKQVKAIVPIKEMEVSYYKDFADFLVKYEENMSKKAKAEDPLTVKLLTGDSKLDLKQKLIDNASAMRNPFKYIRDWIKGEIMDLQCVLECIARKEGIESTKSKAISKVKDNKDTVEKMNTGKFTFKGMFMSNTSKASETQNIL